MKQFMFALFAVVIGLGTIRVGDHQHSGHGITRARMMERSASAGPMVHSSARATVPFRGLLDKPLCEDARQSFI